MLVIISFSSETFRELSRIYTVQKECKLRKQTFQALQGTWQSAEGEPAGFLPSWASLAKAFCVVWLEGDSWASLLGISGHMIKESGASRIGSGGWVWNLMLKKISPPEKERHDESCLQPSGEAFCGRLHTPELWDSRGWNWEQQAEVARMLILAPSQRSIANNESNSAGKELFAVNTRWLWCSGTNHVCV